MTLTIELEDSLASEIEKQTVATGQSAAHFVEAAVRALLLKSQRNAVRNKVIDEALDNLRISGASLGREGRAWSEISHESHRY